ncbi:MAG TPA: peptide-methionine (R)-S-oxide reductase MsrB [Pirellulaceae bacterium]|jgi:methionine-R-sulfoxide reductase
MLKTNRPYSLVVFMAATMAVLATAFVWQSGAFAWQTGPKASSSAAKATRPAGQKGVRMVRVKVFNRAGELVGPLEMPKVTLTAAEWKKKLTPDQFKILRSSSTERPFCGVLLDNKKVGVYACAGCGLPLFTSDAKFESGTGWPSFFQPIAAENIAEREDRSHGMARVEINCTRCDGHLGHVFPDGPRPTGLRYCMNSESLQFTAKEDLKKLADPAAGE